MSLSLDIELVWEEERRREGRGGGGNPNFFLHISSSLVNVRLHTEN